MPIDYRRYPPHWKRISAFVRFVRAKNRCEWCDAKNHEPHPVTGTKVVLTVAHVHDKDPMNADLENLAALCQRCHLDHDRPGPSRRDLRDRPSLFDERGTNVSPENRDP